MFKNKILKINTNIINNQSEDIKDMKGNHIHDSKINLHNKDKREKNDYQRPEIPLEKSFDLKYYIENNIT